MNMKFLRLILTVLLASVVFLPAVVLAADLPRRSPFGVAVSTNLGADGPGLKVDFTVPTDCVLYAERLHFLGKDGAELAPKNIPAPVVLVDKVTGHKKTLYDRNFSVRLEPVEGSLLVKFQGCTNAACYFPESEPLP